MKALVTGVAGFIGSTLAERLCATAPTSSASIVSPTTTPRAIKERNLAGLNGQPRFRFVESSIQAADLANLLADRTHVFHLAAQAGVRKSWGRDFDRLHSEQHRGDADAAGGVCRAAARTARVRIELVGVRRQCRHCRCAKMRCRSRCRPTG